jgi:hypothetical protein
MTASLLAIAAKHWRVLAAVGLAAVLALGWLQLKSLVAENAALRLEAENARSNSAYLTAALAENRRALEAREAENRGLAEERRAALAELEKVCADDEKACDWAGDPIPDGVYKLLK